MAIGGNRHATYCWVLPTFWCSQRSKRLHQLPPASDSLSDRRVCTVRSSMSGGSMEEKEDAYKQFANMLGEGSSMSSQPVGKQNASYTTFEERLNQKHADDKNGGKKSVAKFTPKKIEINPEDYNIFDEMLEKTGGKGRKPVKGAKPYSRRATGASREGAIEGSGILEDQLSYFPDVVNLEEEADDSKSKAVLLTEEEKAEAYAVMMEEFGPGVHDGVETWSPDDDLDDLTTTPQQQQLLRPPQRPGDSSPVKPPGRRFDYDSPSSSVATNDADEQAESVSLMPKPAMRINSSFTSTTEVAETGKKSTSTQEGREEKPTSIVSQNILTRPSRLSGPSSAQDLNFDESIREVEVQNTTDAVAFQGDETVRLNSRPHRSAPVNPQTTKEGPLKAQAENLTPKAGLQALAQIVPEVLPKPQKPSEPPLASKTESVSTESDLSFDRKRRPSRKQRYREQVAVVLKNPKLVYKI